MHPTTINFDDRHREAAASLAALRRALDAHRIVLPTLELDVAALVGSTTRPLITLGRCTPDTALALARALRARGV